MIDGDVRPAELIVEAKGWGVVGDADTLRRICEELVARNQDKVCIRVCEPFHIVCSIANDLHAHDAGGHHPRRQSKAIHMVRRAGYARDEGTC